ncbi:hypothetical protein SLA2020_516120 [Shorea laevis]
MTKPESESHNQSLLSKGKRGGGCREQETKTQFTLTPNNSRAADSNYQKQPTSKKPISRNVISPHENRHSLVAPLTRRALNVSGHIRHHNPIGDRKIPGVIFIDLNQPRPRSSLAAQKAYIRSEIKPTTQSLD